MSWSKSLIVGAVLGVVLVAAACTPMTPAGPWVAAGCYGSPVVDAPDFRYSGAPNVRGNLTVSLDIASFTLSTDGSCSGIPLGDPYAVTMVRGTTQAAAEIVCESLGLSDGVGQLQPDYPGLPADAWVCNPPPEI